MTEASKCPMCGAVAVRLVAGDREVVADDGTRLGYRDALMACSSCGERYYTHEQAMASSRARAGALRQHAGLLTPGEIRAFREQHGLSQAQLERILQTGAKTVVRWERGTVCQSRAADQLLRLLMANPSNLRLLTERAVVNVAVPGVEAMPTQNVVVSLQLGFDVSLAPNVPFIYGGNSTVFFDETIVSPTSGAPPPIATADPAAAEYARAA